MKKFYTTSNPNSKMVVISTYMCFLFPLFLIAIFIYFDYNFDFISQKSQKELYLSQRPPPLPSYTLSNITHKPTTNNNNKLRKTLHEERTTTLAESMTEIKFFQSSSTQQQLQLIDESITQIENSSIITIFSINKSITSSNKNKIVL